MPLAPELRPQRKPEFALEVLDGEILLLHPAQGRVLHCNQTAALIWQLCDGRRTIHEIAALLEEAFPESAEGMKADVSAALEQFQAADALTFA